MVFPEPLGPSNPVTAPAGTSKLTSSIPRADPYMTVKESTLKAGCPAADVITMPAYAVQGFNLTE